MGFAPFHILVANPVHESHECWLDERDRRHYGTAYRYPPELIVSHSSKPEQHQQTNRVVIDAANQQAFVLAAVAS